MDYLKIMEKIAAENDTTLEEVDVEIRKALEAAKISVDPDLFISMVVSTLNETLSI